MESEFFSGQICLYCFVLFCPMNIKLFMIHPKVICIGNCFRLFTSVNVVYQGAILLS